ncbi:MAG: branched-chain amino acid ABC transporter permease [Janthinobacterium lividum]
MTRETLLGLVVVLLAAALAFVVSDYRLFQLTTLTIYAIAILGLALVTGYNGQISLGHGAFYAVGAYVTAILTSMYDVPYWATLPVAAVVCAGIGFLVGLPALRLGGLYLALTTFALAVATPQLLKHKALEHWTGGVQGIVVDKPDPPFGLPINADQWVYLFSLAVAAILFGLAANLVRGRVGRAMRAVRDNALAAEATGIDVALFKTRTFAVSAMVTGIAGSLSAIVVGFVSPDSFTVFLSITLFTGLVVGGAATIAGPVFGAIFITFLPNVAEQISKAAPGVIYGVVLIAFMFLLPAGVAGGLGRLLRSTNK